MIGDRESLTAEDHWRRRPTMRKLKRELKIRRQEPIPDDLRDFLYEVHELIEAGDETATTPSDDLLQCEAAYGGLDGRRKHTFSFTYFPKRGSHVRWELRFHVDEITMIADGALSELTLFACRDKSCGNRFHRANEACMYCDYVDEHGRHLAPPEVDGAEPAPFTISWNNPQRPDAPQKAVANAPDAAMAAFDTMGTLREPTVVTIACASGARILITRGGSQAILVVRKPDGAAFMAVANRGAAGTFGFADGEDWEELPARYAIPAELARQAALDFLAKGELPVSVEWESREPDQR